MLALLYIVCTQKIKQKQVDVTVTDKCLECDKTFTGHFYVILLFTPPCADFKLNNTYGINHVPFCSYF